ncbi:MAG TPA: efflux RND transporter periplasmic adaptor subunit [Candidatus Dormibacteraeota bacterium]|nr:efflux RND transporter periplasmic adaptor subunit [Candidatus Dormibacteraeota bacterium]
MASISTPPKPDLGSLRIHDNSRKKSNVGKRVGIGLLVIVLLGVIAAAAAYAFRNSRPVVDVATAAKAEIGGRQATLNASGYVTPRRRATIAAKITGRVTSVHFDEGTRVTEGQLLATLDDSDVQRALESAKADRDSAQAAIADFQVQLKNADIELVRAQKLQAAGVQTQEALDNAVTAADSLKAKISLAKQQVVASNARIKEAEQAVDNTIIRAPFAGIVVSKDAQVGEIISPISAGGGFTRTGIATVVDMKSLEMEIDVNEAYISKVKPGQPVKAFLDAYPDRELGGSVRTVIPTADRQKATVKVRITFNKIEDFILPDMGIKVTFLGDEEKIPAGTKVASAILIPQDAVRTDGSQKIVFLIKSDRAERRAITVGNNRGSDVEVIAGLNAGDSVVVKPPDNLKDGEAVEIKK